MFWREGTWGICRKGSGSSHFCFLVLVCATLGMAWRVLLGEWRFALVSLFSFFPLSVCASAFHHNNPRRMNFFSTAEWGVWHGKLSLLEEHDSLGWATKDGLCGMLLVLHRCLVQLSWQLELRRYPMGVYSVAGMSFLLPRVAYDGPPITADTLGTSRLKTAATCTKLRALSTPLSC